MRPLVGLHAPNKDLFSNWDYDVIKRAKIECLKMMQHTEFPVWEKLANDFPDLQFICRTYDRGLQNEYFNQGRGRELDPHLYSSVIGPFLQSLVDLLGDRLIIQIHNEPNHLHKYEGWSDSIEDAKQFNHWVQVVLSDLRTIMPYTRYVFPGLAVPHNDENWIRECIGAISQFDYCGVHCYWQNPTSEDRNHLVDYWGLRWNVYRNILAEQGIGNKPFHVLEAGNSNHQSGYPQDKERVANEIEEWYQAAFYYDNLLSCCPFIESSNDPTWDGFAWIDTQGNYHPVVDKVANMRRESRQ